MAFKPTTSSSQAASISLSDKVGQFTELNSTQKVESLQLTKCLEKILKDQELTDKKVEKLCEDQTALKENILKAVELMQKNQSNLTESLDKLTKAVNNDLERNKGTLGQIEKSATQFTRKNDFRASIC